MTRKFISAFGAALFAALLILNPTQAREDHRAEATKHALAAAEAGKQGDMAGLSEHAAAAKNHAEAAEKEKANAHLEAGIEELDKALEQAEQGHADIAGKAARAAATHLKAAEKSF